MMMVMTTRHAPATNTQARLSTSITRTYCASIAPPSKTKAGQTKAGCILEGSSRPSLTCGPTSLHVLDALDERGVVGAVLVPYGLHGCLEGLAVGHIVDHGAGRLHVVHGF